VSKPGLGHRKGALRNRYPDERSVAITWARNIFERAHKGALIQFSQKRRYCWGGAGEKEGEHSREQDKGGTRDNHGGKKVEKDDLSNQPRKRGRSLPASLNLKEESIAKKKKRREEKTARAGPQVFKTV